MFIEDVPPRLAGSDAGGVLIAHEGMEVERMKQPILYQFSPCLPAYTFRHGSRQAVPRIGIRYLFTRLTQDGAGRHEKMSKMLDMTLNWQGTEIRQDEV